MRLAGSGQFRGTAKTCSKNCRTFCSNYSRIALENAGCRGGLFKLMYGPTGGLIGVDVFIVVP